MAHAFRPYGPDQVFLLPPSPTEWLPEGHLAYQMLDVVGELDMTTFVSEYSDDGRGAAAFSPYMMVALILLVRNRHILDQAESA
jgi:transposase